SSSGRTTRPTPPATARGPTTCAIRYDRPTSWGNEFIAEPIDGPDLDVGLRVVEPAAQVLHLGVYEIEIISLVDMVAPHGFGQRGLIDHMVRAAHEIVEDVVLLAQQFHLAPGHLHTAAVGVEADIPHVEALLPVALVT